MSQGDPESFSNNGRSEALEKTVQNFPGIWSD